MFYTLFADCQVVAFGSDWIIRCVRYFYRYKRVLVDKLHGDASPADRPAGHSCRISPDWSRRLP